MYLNFVSQNDTSRKCTVQIHWVVCFVLRDDGTSVKVKCLLTLACILCIGANSQCTDQLQRIYNHLNNWIKIGVQCKISNLGNLSQNTEEENNSKLEPRPWHIKHFLLFCKLHQQSNTGHFMMSSKLFGIIFLYFVIFLLLIILYTARPTPTEIVNLFDVDISVSQNNPGEVGNVACASKSKTSIIFNENGTTMPSQWCDSCINYHQYKALISPKNTPDTYLDMVMFIPSQPGDSSFQRRQFLRKFPLNSTYFPQIKIRHVFVFGKFSFSVPLVYWPQAEFSLCNHELSVVIIDSELGHYWYYYCQWAPFMTKVLKS